MNEAIVKHLLATLVLNSIFNQVKSATNVKILWEEFSQLMEEHTKTYTINLERQMYVTHCGNDKDVCLLFKKLANMCKQLAATGKNIPDDKYTSLLLNSLPSDEAARVM